MPEIPEKRGPIEKSPKGWPINLLGVIALAIFGLVIVFLIIKPFLSNKTTVVIGEQEKAAGGQIVIPTAGQIVRSDQMTIELSADEPKKVQKVQVWAKTYADGKWQMIGEVQSAPFKLDWSIPDSYKNKAIAITSHIYTKDGQLIKDPGGWREGIIILGN